MLKSLWSRILKGDVSKMIWLMSVYTRISINYLITLIKITTVFHWKKRLEYVILYYRKFAQYTSSCLCSRVMSSVRSEHALPKLLLLVWVLKYENWKLRSQTAIQKCAGTQYIFCSIFSTQLLLLFCLHWEDHKKCNFGKSVGARSSGYCFHLQSHCGVSPSW